IANFRVLPRETTARKEILDHAARFTFKRTEDGSFTHKLDRRTLIREPLDVWDDLPHVTCPALIIKISNSFVLDIELARKMVAALPKGKLAQVADSYHHVMFDNPDGLIAALSEFLARLEGARVQAGSW